MGLHCYNGTGIVSCALQYVHFLILECELQLRQGTQGRDVWLLAIVYFMNENRKSFLPKKNAAYFTRFYLCYVISFICLFLLVLLSFFLILLIFVYSFCYSCRYPLFHYYILTFLHSCILAFLHSCIFAFLHSCVGWACAIWVKSWRQQQ